jgi:RNA polymerase sigma-70 factor (ECF subfamily)
MRTGISARFDAKVRSPLEKEIPRALSNARGSGILRHQPGSRSVALSPEEFEADVQLVLAVQAGEASAFAELYQRHHASVRRTCLRQLMNGPEAEEVVQATFVRAFERIDQCTGPRNFGAWVHVISQRLCVDAIRARQRVSPEQEPIDADEAITGGGSPEDALIDHEDARYMRAALSTLPARQRDVVVARDIDGRRPAEIAAALGISVGAVDSVLLRARRRLALVYHQLASERGATAASTSAAASLASAVGVTQSSPVGRRVASAIVGAAMALAPMAHPHAPAHGEPSRPATATVPAVPRIAVTPLPEPLVGSATPEAQPSLALPIATPAMPTTPATPSTPVAPGGVSPVTSKQQHHATTSDVIAELQRVLGTLPKPYRPSPG